MEALQGGDNVQVDEVQYTRRTTSIQVVQL
jgi:hypothetical protein